MKKRTSAHSELPQVCDGEKALEFETNQLEDFILR